MTGYAFDQRLNVDWIDGFESGCYCTVRDPVMTSNSSVGTASESMTIFVAIKENGQAEGSGAGFVTCLGNSAQIIMWKDAGFRDFGRLRKIAIALSCL